MRAKGKIGVELCPFVQARTNCVLEGEKKSNAARRGGRGERKRGKAYQTGFQITEVIPSVIDSPIATYRISVGSGSWAGNYKREETRARARERERWTAGIKESARCVYVCVCVRWWRRERRGKTEKKITKKAGRQKEKVGK